MHVQQVVARHSLQALLVCFWYVTCECLKACSLDTRRFHSDHRSFLSEHCEHVVMFLFLKVNVPSLSFECLAFFPRKVRTHVQQVCSTIYHRRLSTQSARSSRVLRSEPGCGQVEEAKVQTYRVATARRCSGDEDRSHAALKHWSDAKRGVAPEL
ncbi:unnamed protein product [Durusdinium trenchii]|uniref:Secreted protein n=1 Tax=Durusdinium trenchii TaxID=1381693 RepID=A0ABP0RR51_9DINO